MGDCKIDQQNGFYSRGEALQCFEYLKRETKKPVLFGEHPYVAIGTADISPFLVWVFSECFEGTMFDDWVTLTSPTNESFAKRCAEELARINGGKYKAVLVQQNRIRANFWRTVAEK